MIRKYLTGRGYTLPAEDWYKWVKLFRQWYLGKVPSFHDYQVFNGSRRVEAHRFSLGMAKQVCREHACLLLNERVTITAEGFEALPELLKELRFCELGNQLVETAFALGTGAFVEYLDGAGLPAMDFVPADMIYPLTWAGDVVTECAFASRKVVRTANGAAVNGYYVQIHTLAGGTYRIENAWLDENGAPLPPPDGVEPLVETGSPIPLFQLFGPAGGNDLCPGCPMGVSVFGNAIDQLKAADILYTSYVNEFELGKKRIMVPLSLATIEMEQSGDVSPRFDPNDAIFYVYEQTEDSSGGVKDGIKETGGNLRAQEHETGLRRMVDLLSRMCGLGDGHFRVEGGQAKTATEVVSEQSDLYKTMVRNEKPLERAMIGMVRALAYLLGLSPELTVNVAFDDSVIEDAGAIAERNVLLVNAGLQSKLRAIMEIYKVDEAEARRILDEINGEARVAQKMAEEAMMREEQGDERGKPSDGEGK